MAPKFGRKNSQEKDKPDSTLHTSIDNMADESASISGETLSSVGDAPHNMVVDVGGGGAKKTTSSKLKKLFIPRRSKRMPINSSNTDLSVLSHNDVDSTDHAGNTSHYLYPNPNNYHHPNPEESSNISALLAAAITIKDRKYHLKTYKQCFVGSEAVDFFLQNGLASSRDEGVYLGNVLLRELRSVEHVCGDHDFKDDNLFYQFVVRNTSVLNRKGSTEGNKANLDKVGFTPAGGGGAGSTVGSNGSGGAEGGVGGTTTTTITTTVDTYNPSNIHNQQRASSVTLSLGDISEEGTTPNTKFGRSGTITSGKSESRLGSSDNTLIRMDKYGFLLEDDRCSVNSASRVPRTSDALDTMNRIKKWEEMLSAGVASGKDGGGGGASGVGGGIGAKSLAFTNTQSKVKYYTRRGLPDTMRHRAWTVLTGVDIIMNEREGEYEELVAKAAEEYDLLSNQIKNRRESTDTTGSMEGKSEGNSVLETIERDIHRTFPKHYLFHNGLDEEDFDESNEEGDEDEGIEQILDSDDEDEEDTTDQDDADDEEGREKKEDQKPTPQQAAVLTEAKKQLFNDMIGRSNAQMSMINVDVDADSSHSSDENTADNPPSTIPEDSTIEDGGGAGTATTTTGDGDNTVYSSSQATSTTGGKELGHGQAALRRVLRAYSMYDTEVGYCQGMNFIAAMFLTFLSEEEAFWLLVVVMNEEPYKLRELFGEDMAGTHEVLYIAEKLIHQFLPKLSNHMEKENIHISMFVTQWLLTIYTSTFPFELVSRVWDCFLVEGWKVVYRVMLALLEYASKDLMKMSFEQILAYFREFPSKVDGTTIMNGSLRIALKRKHIQKHVNEWRRQTGGYETRSKNSGKHQRRPSAGSSVSSTFNSTGTGPKTNLAIAKGLLKKSKEIKIQNLSQTLIPIVGGEKFAVALYNVFTPEECAELIERTEETGYESAHIYNARTKETLRNCTRSCLDDNVLAENWYERILHALSGTEHEERLLDATWVWQAKNGKPIHAVGLNEMLRILKYSPGQYFCPHTDTKFVRGKGQGDRAGETSYVSVYIYLSEKFKGGNLRFTSGARYHDIVPKTGMVLLFDHNILHESCKVTKGTKYVVRSDVMYSTKAESFTCSAGTGFTQEL